MSLRLTKAARLARLKEQRREQELRRKPRKPRNRKGRKKSPRYWIGLDGEGVTVGEPWHPPGSSSRQRLFTGTRHIYRTMSYSSAEGPGVSEIHPEGFTTAQALEFILRIPKRARIAAYGFGYDLTMILRDLPAEALHRLTHPERRKKVKKKGQKLFVSFRPVYFFPHGTKNGYRLDWLKNRFSVSRAGRDYLRLSRDKKRTIRRVVWDKVQFYQMTFVKACALWNVGTPESRAEMQAMKDDRRNLSAYDDKQILTYSERECAYLAELSEKLDDACESLSPPLSLAGQYHGAGSIASALLKRWKIVDPPLPELSPEVHRAAQLAFFGGRFELSRRGIVKARIHDYDISSAYPYQIRHLPCMRCGTWSLTGDLERARASKAALVNYGLSRWRGKIPPWGPFPFRVKDGSIPYPIESGGGWLHKEEFLVGREMWPNVRFLKAWVYETSCSHEPFAAISDVYRDRIRLGKDGPGIVLKLGTNGCAGKMMQTIGAAQFFHPVYAGMITSGTRAELLRLLARHEHWSDVLMFATDGVWSLSEVTPPAPRDTGTADTGKPLGAWEHQEFPNGCFLARPGIYFPLGLSSLEEAKEVKARGLSVKKLWGHRAAMISAFLAGEEKYLLEDPDPYEALRTKRPHMALDRFTGIRGGITRRLSPESPPEDPEYLYEKSPSFALWSLEGRRVSFAPLPKRTLAKGALQVRRMPCTEESLPYEKGKWDDLDEIELEGESTSQLDQPDFAEFVV